MKSFASSSSMHPTIGSVGKASVVVTAFITAACSPEPSDVIEDYLRALDEGRGAEAFSLICPEDQSDVRRSNLYNLDERTIERVTTVSRSHATDDFTKVTVRHTYPSKPSWAPDTSTYFVRHTGAELCLWMDDKTLASAEKQHKQATALFTRGLYDLARKKHTLAADTIRGTVHETQLRGRQIIDSSLNFDTRMAKAQAEKREAQEKSDYKAKISVRATVRRERWAIGPVWFFGGEVTNSGDRDITVREVKVYGLGRNGLPVFEEDISLGSWEFGKVLKPGYSVTFEEKEYDPPPSTWVGSVRGEVSRYDLR